MTATTKANPECELVAERLALGEPLAELDAHVADCAGCQKLARLPGSLAKTGHAADPGIGFASRVTAGAQHRIGVRRRRRMMAAAALSVAAMSALVLGVTHQPDDTSVAYAFPTPDLAKYKPALAPSIVKHDHEPTTRAVDPDVRTLVRLANVEREIHLSANWGRIEKPLRPYRRVLEGKAP